MRPTLPVPMPELLLFRCQQLPVMNRVHLLHHAHKRRWLAFAYVPADFTYLSQSAAKIIASVTEEEFRSNVDNVTFAQIGHAAGSAGLLDFKKARFAGASSVGGRESAACFRAVVCLAHIFCAKHSA